MKLKYLVFSIILLAVFFPTQFSYADTCECFCASSTGAESKGNLKDVNACRGVCDIGQYLGCYTDVESAKKPANRVNCWSQYECTNDTTEINGVQVASDWGGQDRTCKAGEGFCYNAAQPVQLSIAILNPNDPDNPITQIDSLADYINVVYNFLIPSASLLAIVMLMLGGLQWMLARGNSGKIGQAQTRIKNAVIGLILLLFAVSMAQIINPNYVKLSHLQIPKIRTITFIDPNSSCEKLEDAGFTIKAVSGTKCGNTGEITSIGESESATFQVGDECDFITCEDTKQSCIREEDGYKCTECSDIVSDASASVCNGAVHQRVDDDKDTEKFYCEYYDANWSEMGTNSCAELVYPKNNSALDCAQLEQDRGASCRSYDEVVAISVGLLDNELDDLQGADDEYPFLKNICTNDPCGFHPPGKTCVMYNPFTDDKIDGWCEGLSGLALGWTSSFLGIDCQTFLERIDCVDSDYLDAIYKAETGDGDEDNLICKDNEGNKIDCESSF